MAKKEINVTSVNVTNATQGLNNLGQQANTTSGNLNNLNNTTNKLNNTLNNTSNASSKYSANIGKLGNSFSGMAGAVGKSMAATRGFSTVLSAAFKWFSAYKIVQAFFDVIKDGIKSIMGFNKEMSRLAAISGESREGLKELEDQAIKLGASSVYTAKQIVGLQIELAKLGFTQKEILNSTKSVSQGATAMGSALSDAASLGGTTLRAFGLDAIEMDRVMGVLAKSTTKSALSFEYLSTALPYVSSTANAMGLSLEDTVSMLAMLADNGLKASTAGTSLRNIFTKIADESKKLGLALGPIRNMDDILIALKELKASGLDVGKAFELTDARAMSALLTIAKQTDKLNDLRDALGDTNGVLEEMSEKQLDNLAGSITKLDSAWDSLILSFRESDNWMKKVVDFLANVIKSMSNSILMAEAINNFQILEKDKKTNEMNLVIQTNTKDVKEELAQLNIAYNNNLAERTRLQKEYYKSTDATEKANIKQRIEELKKESTDTIKEIKERNDKIATITSETTENVLKERAELAIIAKRNTEAEIAKLEKHISEGNGSSAHEREIDMYNAIINEYVKDIEAFEKFKEAKQNKSIQNEERYLAEQEKIENKRIKAAEEYAKKQAAIREKELSEANKIYANEAERSMTALQRLEAKYNKELDMLTKYGLDTKQLTENYLKEKEALVNRYTLSESEVITNNYNITLNELFTNLNSKLITEEEYHKASIKAKQSYEDAITLIEQKAASKRSINTQRELDLIATQGTADVKGLDQINDDFEQGVAKLDELDLRRRWGVLGEQMYNNEMHILQLEQIQGTMAVVDAQIAALEIKKDLTDQELLMLRKAQKERNKLQRQEGKLKREGGKDWEGWASIAVAATAAVGGAMQSFAQLAKEDSKAQKALAITGVTMDTISGGISAVVGGIQQFGPILGPIIGGTTAAGLLASGIVAINNIKNAENGLGGGDVVPPVGPSPEAVAPPPISFTRNILGQEDIALQKEIANGQVVEVSIIDIEKAQSSYRAKVKESKF